MFEEMNDHVCSEVLDVGIKEDTGTVMVFDSKKWYKYTMVTPETQQGEDSDEHPHTQQNPIFY